MAVSKTLTLLFAIVAVVVAEEAPKEKRDIFVGAVPYGAPGYENAPRYVAAAPGYVAAAPGYVAAAPAATAYVAAAPAATAYVARPAGYVAAPYTVASPSVAYPAYDDGKYYPGKYEKPTFYNAPRVIY